MSDNEVNFQPPAEDEKVPSDGAEPEIEIEALPTEGVETQGEQSAPPEVAAEAEKAVGEIIQAGADFAAATSTIVDQLEAEFHRQSEIFNAEIEQRYRQELERIAAEAKDEVGKAEAEVLDVVKAAQAVGKVVGEGLKKIKQVVLQESGSRFWRNQMKNLDKMSVEQAVVLAKKMISGGEQYWVLDEINSFPKETRLEIAEWLIEKGKTEDVLERVGRFDRDEQSHIAKWVIGSGGASILVERIHRFSQGFDVVVASELVEQGYGKNVLANIRYFRGLTLDIAKKIEGFDPERMVVYLNNFRASDRLAIIKLAVETGDKAALNEVNRAFNILGELDVATAKYLIDSGASFIVYNYLGQFGEANQADIIKYVIAKGNCTELAIRVKNFSEENRALIAKELINAGRIRLVNKYRHYFSRPDANSTWLNTSILDAETAKQLDDKQEDFTESGILRYVDTLSSDERLVVANQLVEEGEEILVAKNFDKFPGLDPVKLVKHVFDLSNDKRYAFINAVGEYSINLHGVIVDAMIAESLWHDLFRSFDKFKGINYTGIVDRAFEAGKEKEVVTNLLYILKVVDADKADSLFNKYLAEFSVQWMQAGAVESNLSPDQLQQVADYLSEHHPVEFLICEQNGNLAPEQGAVFLRKDKIIDRINSQQVVDSWLGTRDWDRLRVLQRLNTLATTPDQIKKVTDFIIEKCVPANLWLFLNRLHGPDFTAEQKDKFFDYLSEHPLLLLKNANHGVSLTETINTVRSLRKQVYPMEVEQADWVDLSFATALESIPSTYLRELSKKSTEVAMGYFGKDQSGAGIHKEWSKNFSAIPQQAFLQVSFLCGGNRDLMAKFSQVYGLISKSASEQNNLTQAVIRAGELTGASLDFLRKSIADMNSDNGKKIGAILAEVCKSLIFFEVLAKSLKWDAESFLSETTSGVPLAEVNKSLKKRIASKLQEALPHPEITVDQLDRLEERWGGNIEPITTYLGRFPEARGYIAELVAGMDSESRWKAKRYDRENPVVQKQLEGLSAEQISMWSTDRAENMSELVLNEGVDTKPAHIRGLITAAVVEHQHIYHSELVPSGSEFIQNRIGEIFRATLPEGADTPRIIAGGITALETDNQVVNNIIRREEGIKAKSKLGELRKVVPFIINAKNENLLKDVCRLSDTVGVRLLEAFKLAKDEGKKTVVLSEADVQELELELSTVETMDGGAEEKTVLQRLGLPDNNKNLKPFFDRRKELQVAIDILRLATLSSREVAGGVLLRGKGDKKTSRKMSEVIGDLKKFFTDFGKSDGKRKNDQPDTLPPSPFLQDLENIEKSLAEDQSNQGVTNRRLAFVSTDNPQMLWQVGKYPIGSGSCQNYESGSHAQSLLGYVGDAHSKAVFLVDINKLPPEDQERVSSAAEFSAALLETPAQSLLEASVARTVLKLAKTGTGHAVFLEPTYTVINKGDKSMDNSFDIFVQDFIARPMGIASARGGDGASVTMPASRNPAGQYEDGAAGNAGHAGMGIQTGTYKVPARFLSEKRTK